MPDTPEDYETTRKSLERLRDEGDFPEAEDESPPDGLGPGPTIQEPLNVDHPTRTIGGQSHRKAESAMRRMFDDSDDPGSDESEGDTPGWARFANKPKNRPKI